MTTTASATYLKDGRVMLKFPYNEWVISGLKYEIPGNQRQWDPQAKVWYVDIVWAVRAIGILQENFDDVEVIHDRGTTPPPPIRKTDPSFAALHLLPSAPPELIDAAYRCLSWLNHPDVGGSTSAMQKINAAHDLLKTRRSA